MEFLIKNHVLKGAEKAKELIEKMEDVLVYFDPDVDGMIAGYFVCKFLKDRGKSFSWYVNSERMHGWQLDTGSVKGRDIIAVDFQIRPEQVREIVGAGCNLISMDHHVNGEKFIRSNQKGKIGIVINNQYPFEADDCHYLSGAGVVFETLIHIDNSFDTEENRALVGLTLLSDVCNIENPYAAEYLRILYNHKYNGYIKYLISHTMGDKDFQFGVPRLDRNYVDFKFSPAINSCLRFNREDEVVEFFLGSGKLNLNFHKRQKVLVEAICKVLHVRTFSHLKVCFYKDWEVQSDEDPSVMSGFVGLVASKQLDKKHSVICYVISKDSNDELYVKRASFRGNNSSAFYLKEVSAHLHCEGHQPAFGIKHLEPTKALFEKVNEACKTAEDQVSGELVDLRPVSNLSFFVAQKAKAMAERNMYVLSKHRQYLRYIGNGCSIKREGASYVEYEIDGVSVMCFDRTVTTSNGIIFPIMERGYLKFYLQAEG